MEPITAFENDCNLQSATLVSVEAAPVFVIPNATVGHLWSRVGIVAAVAAAGALVAPGL